MLIPTEHARWHSTNAAWLVDAMHQQRWGSWPRNSRIIRTSPRREAKLIGHSEETRVRTLIFAPARIKCRVVGMFPESEANISSVVLRSMRKAQRITPGRTWRMKSGDTGVRKGAFGSPP